MVGEAADEVKLLLTNFVHALIKAEEGHNQGVVSDHVCQIIFTTDMVPYIKTLVFKVRVVEEDCSVLGWNFVDQALIECLGEVGGQHFGDCEVCYYR